VAGSCPFLPRDLDQTSCNHSHQPISRQHNPRSKTSTTLRNRLLHVRSSIYQGGVCRMSLNRDTSNTSLLVPVVRPDASSLCFVATNPHLSPPRMRLAGLKVYPTAYPKLLIRSMRSHTSGGVWTCSLIFPIGSRSLFKVHLVSSPRSRLACLGEGRNVVELIGHGNGHQRALSRKLTLGESLGTDGLETLRTHCFYNLSRLSRKVNNTTRMC